MIMVIFLKTGSSCVAKAGFELSILLIQFPEYWDYMHMPPNPADGDLLK
jgi:hypothetical protein